MCCMAVTLILFVRDWPKHQTAPYNTLALDKVQTDQAFEALDQFASQWPQPESK